MTDRKRKVKYGGASVYRRASDNRWVAVVELGYIDGKRKRATAYGATRKEVEARIPELRKEGLKRLQSSGEIKTVSEFLNYWIETSVKKELALTTVESYMGVVANHVAPVLGRKRLASLDRQDVQQMLEVVAMKPGVGPRSVQNVRTVLRKAFNDAVAWELIERNPVLHTTIRPVPRSNRHALTVEQAQILFTQVADDRFEALYWLAAIYGLRRGECLGLMWSDVDPDRREIRILRQIVVAGNRPLITELKTKQSRRTLPLLTEIEAALGRRRLREQEERLIAGSRWQDHGLIFPSTIGTPYQPANMHKQFKRHIAAAGLPDIELHSLRHTAASFLVALNVHPRIAMEILGHTNIKTTMEIYSHAQQAGMREALESVENVLRRGK